MPFRRAFEYLEEAVPAGNQQIDNIGGDIIATRRGQNIIQLNTRMRFSCRADVEQSYHQIPFSLEIALARKPEEPNNMQLANISWLNLLRLLSLPLAQQLDAGVREGLIVRTRTDANTVEARSRDYSEAEAAMASGAQAVSTDYYPGAPDPLNLGFVVTLPERAMARCSPERVSAGCRLRP